MKLKKAESNKTSVITFRCKMEDEHKIKQKANIYCEGNVSQYLIYAALNFIPNLEDFEKEEPK